VNRVHFSSKSQEWATPQALFDELNAEFGFTTDVAATDENTKCDRYFTKECDALDRPWTGVCWMNPPYGRQIGKWVKKAYEAALLGSTIVCLLPAKTDTAWWHDYVVRGEVRFLRGRITFEGAKHNAPFGSAVVIFRPPPQ